MMHAIHSKVDAILRLAIVSFTSLISLLCLTSHLYLSPLLLFFLSHSLALAD